MKIEDKKLEGVAHVVKDEIDESVGQSHESINEEISELERSLNEKLDDLNDKIECGR